MYTKRALCPRRSNYVCVHIGTFNNGLCVCVCVYGCQDRAQLGEARPTQQAMRVKRIICQYVRSFRICTASPVASCQFRHHHHASPSPVPGPPTGPQATLLRWPFVRAFAVDVVVAIVGVVVVCRAHKFFVPAAYSIARSVNTHSWLTAWLPDRPTDRPTDWLSDWLSSPAPPTYLYPVLPSSPPLDCLSLGCFHHSVSNG